MPTIEVDIIVFIIETILAFILPIPIIALLVYKSYRNPEWWLRVRHQDWIYAGVKTMTGRLRTIAVNTKDIGSDGMIKLFGKRRIYFIRDQDAEGKPCAVPWRYGKMLYLFQWENPMALAWSPNPGLESKWYPDALHDRIEARTLMMLAKAHAFMQWMWASVGLMIVVMIIVGVLTFTVIGMTNEMAKLNHALQNATVTSPPQPPVSR